PHFPAGGTGKGGGGSGKPENDCSVFREPQDVVKAKMQRGKIEIQFVGPRPSYKKEAKNEIQQSRFCAALDERHHSYHRRRFGGIGSRVAGGVGPRARRVGPKW